MISLAGLHSNAAATGTTVTAASFIPYAYNFLPAELAARFKEDGMLAYVELVQRKEKEIGCDVLTHQKWFVKSQLIDAALSEWVLYIGAEPITSIGFCRASLQALRLRLLLGKTRQSTPSEVAHTCISTGS